MKISKKNLLIVSSVLSLSTLGLTFVSAAGKNLFMNPNNAVLRIKQVKIISTENNNSALLKNNSGFLKVETNNLNNFIIGEIGANLNSISGQNSDILGGIKNQITGSESKYNVIVGGESNVNKGEYNTIIGGKNNNINSGKNETIAGGRNNNIEAGESSVIVGGHNNTINGNYSVIIGNNNLVNGNNSVALGSGSHINANNSFLWSDGNSQQTLDTSDTFAIIAQNGAVINTNNAHSFAKLTLGGPLIISSKENQPNIECNGGKGGGILKIQKSNSNNTQLCLCSCDGNGWNSMFKNGNCLSICNNSYQKPECGTEIQRICSSNKIIFTGSCEKGKVIDGTGSYFVDKNDMVHRSCQTKDGQVTSCSGTAIDVGCNHEYGVQTSCQGTTIESGGCTYQIPSAVNGGTQTVNTNTLGRSGSVKATCNNGTFSYSNWSCTSTSCPGTTTASGGCTYQIPSAVNGGTQTVNTNTLGKIGSVEAICNNGTFSYSNWSCTSMEYGACDTSEPYGCQNIGDIVNKVDTMSSTEWQWYCKGSGDTGSGAYCHVNCSDLGQEGTLEWTSLHNGSCVKGETQTNWCHTRGIHHVGNDYIISDGSRCIRLHDEDLSDDDTDRRSSFFYWGDSTSIVHGNSWQTTSRSHFSRLCEFNYTQCRRDPSEDPCYLWDDYYHLPTSNTWDNVISIWDSIKGEVGGTLASNLNLKTSGCMVWEDGWTDRCPSSTIYLSAYADNPGNGYALSVTSSNAKATKEISVDTTAYRVRCIR